MRYLFPANERLKKNTLFKNVIEYGRKYRNEFMVLYVLPTKEGERKTGFSVSRKIKNVCLKHRIKRRIKEAYRLNLDKLKKGFCAVIIGEEKTEKLKFKETENILLDLFKNANIIKNNG